MTLKASAVSPKVLEARMEGEILANRYRLGRELGQGGMGRVYEAVNLVTGKLVAIKRMHPERQSASRMRGLLREARAAGRIRHANVVDVYDVGEHNGRLFLVMELLRGQSLADYLKQHHTLAPQAALRMLLPAMHGVQAAHARGVVHRDLKPANIFLPMDAEGGALPAKVLDFGVSKIVANDADAADLTLTRGERVAGTPHYMAPEQLDENREADQRVDVYAFGVLLYQLLTGRLPFEANSLSTLTLRITEGHFVPLTQLRPEVSACLANVIARAMAVEPCVRFASVSELIEALEPFLSDPAPSRPLVPAEPNRIRRWPHGLALLVLSGALVWAGYRVYLAAPSESAARVPAQRGHVAAQHEEPWLEPQTPSSMLRPTPAQALGGTSAPASKRPSAATARATSSPSPQKLRPAAATRRARKERSKRDTEAESADAAQFNPERPSQLSAEEF